MPVLPNQDILTTQAARIVSEHMRKLGKLAFQANMAKHGKVGRPFTSKTAALAGAKGWTPEKRALRAANAASRSVTPQVSSATKVGWQKWNEARLKAVKK